MLVNWEIPDRGEITLVAPSNILLKNVFVPETQVNEPTEVSHTAHNPPLQAAANPAADECIFYLDA